MNEDFWKTFCKCYENEDFFLIWKKILFASFAQIIPEIGCLPS